MACTMRLQAVQTVKSKRYATSYYTENTENGSVTLEGIRDVNIAVPTSLYNEAQEAIKEGKNCSNQLLSIIGSLQNVSETAPESGEYKVLNGDGTLTAMKTETKDTYSSILPFQHHLHGGIMRLS